MLSLSENQYNSIIDNSLDAIIIFDTNGIIVRINPAVSLLFGFQASKILGHSLDIFNFTSCLRNHCPLVKGTLLCQTQQTCEFTASTINKETLTLRANIISINSAQEKPLSCAILQDITEQQKAEERLKQYSSSLELKIEARTKQLQKARDQAEQANKAKSNFLSNMSHELRTPLHGILSFANMGMQRVNTMSTEKIATYFELISHSGERLLHLLNELLDLTKLDSHGVVLKIGLIDFYDCLKQCIEEQLSNINAKGLSVNVDIQMKNTRLNCDSFRVSQIISNLLSNAIKFSFPDQYIDIKIEYGQLIEKNDALKFIIQNKGQTIPDNELETIFERFSQSSLESTGTRGAGLGLTISREIAYLHHGKLYSIPNVHEGACFELLLPIALKIDDSL